jgi:tetratricopeptide (TPR) repeat protein
LAVCGVAPAAGSNDAVTAIGGVPPAIDELFNKAQVLQKEQQWSGAADIYRRILSRESTNESALFGLGTVYIQLDDFKQAAPLLEQVRRKMPDHPAVLNNLAWIYARSADPALRDPATALRYARQAVVTAPSDYNFWNTLAEAYFAAGDFMRAARVGRQALQLAKVNGESDPKTTRDLLERCRAAGAIVPADETAAPGPVNDQP